MGSGLDLGLGLGLGFGLGFGSGFGLRVRVWARRLGARGRLAARG